MRLTAAILRLEGIASSRVNVDYPFELCATTLKFPFPLFQDLVLSKP